MVVGVDLLVAAELLAEDLAGAVGQHLVGVHVQAHARSRLKDVDDEVLVVLAVEDLLRSLSDGSSLLRRDEAKLLIRLRGSELDHRQRADEERARLEATDREVRDGAGGLGSVEGMFRYFNRAE